MLPSPATIRWSSSSSFTAARAAGEPGLQPAAGRPPPSGSGPSASNGRPFVELIGRHQVDRAEPPRIAQRQPPALVGLDQQMVVLAELVRVDPPVRPTCRDGRPSCRRDRCGSGHIWRAGRASDRRPGQPLAQVVGERPAADRRAAARPGGCAGPSAPARARGRWFRLREVRAWRRYGEAAPFPARGAAMGTRSISATSWSAPRKRRAASAASSRRSPAATT